MKIYTLGTSHGDSTFCRFNSSTVYEIDDGTFYLIDAGAPCEALMRRKGLERNNLRAAFITHMHDDHAGGLSGLIKQLIKYGQNRKDLFSLYLPEKTAIVHLKNWIKSLHEDADSKKIEYNTVCEGEIYSDKNLSVTAIRTAHLRTRGRLEGDPCSFAYVLHFKKDDIKILHTGDLKGDFSDFPKVSQTTDFDLCICEATHYKPEIALDIFRSCRFKKLIFNHIGDEWHNRIEDGNEIKGEENLLNLCKDLPYNVDIAHDGDEFEV